MRIYGLGDNHLAMQAASELQFIATKWVTPEDKLAFFEWAKKFMLKGCPQHLWHKSKYKRLSMMFGHIAHYDIHGFWCTWFSTNKQCNQWLAHVKEHTCYGDPAWTWSDVEMAMKWWLDENETAVRVAVTRRFGAEKDRAMKKSIVQLGFPLEIGG